MFSPMPMASVATRKSTSPDWNRPTWALRVRGDVAAVDAPLFPGILKTACLGYDGKGQAVVAQRGDLAAAWNALGGVPCVLEQRLLLRCEISVIVARSRTGQVVHLPVQQNLHLNGVLAVIESDANELANARDARADPRVAGHHGQCLEVELPQTLEARVG